MTVCESALLRHSTPTRGRQARQDLQRERLERKAQSGDRAHVYALLYELRPSAEGAPSQTQFSFVQDRPSHDRRYAIDTRKIERKLVWKPAEMFESGIRKTVKWYLDHPEWDANVQSNT